MVEKRRVVVLDVVGLTPSHFNCRENMPYLSALLDRGRLTAMRPVFPCVTLPVQASLTTGATPQEHGVVSNGFYFTESRQVSFWEQPSTLVQKERIWDRLKKKDPALKTAALFFQNTLYASCDAVITPKPLHTDEGLIQWCYSKPVGLYEDICEEIGEFNLFHYWGPMASIESTRWISKAAVEAMARIRPNLLLVYMPHLDYCSQRLGPESPLIGEELKQLDEEIGRIVRGVDDLGLTPETTFVVLSEYAFSAVRRDIPINRLLRERGLLEVRTIKGREYLDFELSPAFAMVDHQTAHVYVKPGYGSPVLKALESIDVMGLLIHGDGKKEHCVDHPRSGDFIAVSDRDRWFSYYWWDDPSKEPDFAPHVDIHRKPGFDPLELFLEPGTFKISQDTSLLRGSHGAPCVSNADRVAFLVSGTQTLDLDIPEDFSVTDVPALIEKILLPEA